MPTLFARAVRDVFRSERIPMRLLWWFAAEGTCDWYGLLADELAPHLGGRDAARARVAELLVPLWERRFTLAAARFPSVAGAASTPRGRALFFGGLYRLPSSPDAVWILDSLGGAPRGLRELAAAERAMASLDLRARWEEVTCHLGEALIALTEGLPPHMERARGVLGEVCFAAGERVGRKMKRAFALPHTPEAALEVLRMSEYVFRVNPEHWGQTDGAAHTGWLEGTACPWFTAPGWNGAHCGIFGQFQSGIASVFGLRYQLTTTIPRHGGHTCRIDVRPIPLGRRPSPPKELA
jgi:hypothetical protein